MDEIHFAPPIKNPRMSRFPNVNANNQWFQPWFPSTAKWISSLHRIVCPKLPKAFWRGFYGRIPHLFQEKTSRCDTDPQIEKSEVGLVALVVAPFLSGDSLEGIEKLLIMRGLRLLRLVRALRMISYFKARIAEVFLVFGVFCPGMLGLENFLPTSGFFRSEPLKVELLAGEQKATEFWPPRNSLPFFGFAFFFCFAFLLGSLCFPLARPKKRRRDTCLLGS